MRAAVYRGPGDIRLEDVSDPTLTPGDVLLSVRSAGVCGTDVRIVKGEHSAYADAVGRIPGHEIVGTVEEAPDGGPVVGELVFVAPNIGCGHCAQCLRGNENLCPDSEAIGLTLDGAFAERVVVPARAVERGNLLTLGDGVSADAAVLIEPLACVLRGQEKVALGQGDTVLVAGGGPVGLLHVALAAARGASLTICSEPSPRRRQAARWAGATVTLDPMGEDIEAAVAEATRGRGVDVAITAAPVHALQASALRVVASGGRVLFFGGLPKSHPTVELDTNLIHYKELLVAGSTASTLDDCRRAADLVTSGRIELDWMVSDRCALADFDVAVARAQDPTALKIVVLPTLEKALPRPGRRDR